MSSFPFLGGSSNVRSPSFDAARCVNLFIEQSESQQSRSPAMLLGTPGLLLWTNLTGGRTRGCIRLSDSVAIVVTGTNVWKVSTDTTAVLIGTVPDISPTVSMAYDSLFVMMVDGPNGWAIDPTLNTVTQIINASFLGADRVDYANGYFIFNKPGTGQFQITGLYGTSIDGLDFATAEGSPDVLVTVIVDHGEVWLLGSNSAEVWYAIGDTHFPFQRIQGAFLEIGCAAAQSVAKADNSIFWLATDDRGFGTVQRAAGYSPQRVSNHAVETAIARYQAAGTIADAVAYTYSQEGHTFYQLTFPTAGATWVMDMSTNLWHERAYRDPLSGVLGRHRSNCQMNFAGKTIVGDWQNGNLYVLDLDTFTDNGDILPAIRVCPHITNDTKTVFHDMLELTMQTGVGTGSGQGANPSLMMRWSDDGGYSWSNTRTAPIGAIGATKSRARFRRLGRARDRLYEVTVTDPVRRVFTAASVTTRAASS